MTSQTIVKMEGISKAFAGIKALDNVQIDLRQGEIHALMGEMVQEIYNHEYYDGISRRTEGEVLINGITFLRSRKQQEKHRVSPWDSAAVSGYDCKRISWFAAELKKVKKKDRNQKWITSWSLLSWRR